MAKKDITTIPIPTFQLCLENKEEVTKSAARLRKGTGHYNGKDIYVMSDWFTMCATQYLIDTYPRRSGKPVARNSLQDRAFYDLQCHKVGAITATLLNRLGIRTHSWGSTTEPCQGLLTHSSIIADYEPKEEEIIRVMYDQSLHQYFPTTQKGYLYKNRRFGRTRDWVSDMFFFRKEGERLAIKLLKNGHASIGDSESEHYIKCFQASMIMTHEAFDPKKDKGEFFIGWMRHPEQEYRVKKWAILPGDPGADKKIDGMFNQQRALKIIL